MLSTHIGAAADVPPWAGAVALCLALAWLTLLAYELRARGRERGGAGIFATGVLALAALVGAVLRPARVTARESRIGARVVVLADTSRSMALDDDGHPRSEARDAAIASLRKASQDVRLDVLGFGEGPPTPLPSGVDADGIGARAKRSDLGGALRALAASSTERPAAVVVVSDGRLDDPPEGAGDEALRGLGTTLGVPVDGIATTRDTPPDASVRRVSAAGAAVAHVPLPLRVEVGCAGGLTCDDLPVAARELREGGPPSLLASGIAHVVDGTAVLDLTVTLDRAGSHVVEVAITAPGGDRIPQNDRRLLTFQVARERVRVLHVAGRPTNDVRALREWLKSDASVDVVAFFILRTPGDDVRASQNELALIPFPVDELFSEHLPSFDAVVLQDIDAHESSYGLEKYLENIRNYVRHGGGLVMIGGQDSFVAGGYAGSPLAEVLPVMLDSSASAVSADTAPFEPEWTPEGLSAPLLGPLRSVVGEELPKMPGTNVLGDLRPGGTALWAHPTRTTRHGEKMPVLAVGESGDGRSVALSVDGTWGLEFSQLGARTSGRGHGALWDGLLGWLMRDPRFEPAQLELADGCTAGLASTLRAHFVSSAGAAVSAPGPAHPASGGSAQLDVTRLDASTPPLHLERPRAPQTSTIDFALPPLEAGAYTAKIRLPGGGTTKYDFACEAGGDEWADSRPDPARLKRLAEATGGAFVFAAQGASLAMPRPTVVSSERRVAPLAPPWAWSLAAAFLLSGHWLVRRRSGLS
jgi:uncharacterized membrane protein